MWFGDVQDANYVVVLLMVSNVFTFCFAFLLLRSNGIDGKSRQSNTLQKKQPLYEKLHLPQQQVQLQSNHQDGDVETPALIQKNNRTVKITLVGAGPGDVELLTLAAHKAILDADLVIADRLISVDILALVKCELLMSQKFKGRANSAQQELNDWMVEAAREGKNVVRLKGGDPFIFGRGLEEVDFCCKAGFDVKVIPGISSSIAGALSGGFSLTSRDVSNQVLISTVHCKNDLFPTLPEYLKQRTIVFLMGISRIEKLMNALLEMEYPSDTPCAVIQNATTKHQKQISGSLSSISIKVRQHDIQSPAIIIVGDIINVNSKMLLKNHPYAYGGVVYSGI